MLTMPTTNHRTISKNIVARSRTKSAILPPRIPSASSISYHDHFLSWATHRLSPTVAISWDSPIVAKQVHWKLDSLIAITIRLKTLSYVSSRVVEDSNINEEEFILVPRSGKAAPQVAHYTNHFDILLGACNIVL